MISVNDIVLLLQRTVAEYFAGERKEMLLILSGSFVIAALAIWLWATTRNGFATAFAITVITFAVLLSATAVSLLVRDKELSSTLVQAIETDRQVSTITAERERIGMVLSKYPYYRYAAGVIALIALLGLTFSARGWIHGVAAGLMLMVVAQVLIDHYSEQRADNYFQKLSTASCVQSR